MNERWRVGWTVLVLIATVGVLASLARYALRVQRLRALRDEVATVQAQLSATHQALATARAVTPSAEDWAATAQAGLGMVRPDDQAARVLPQTPTPGPASPRPAEAAASPGSKPPVYWWWQLLFGSGAP